MEQLGLKHEGSVYTTRLKLRLLVHLPNMCAQHQGRDVLLAFNVSSAIPWQTLVNWTLMLYTWSVLPKL